MGSSKGGSDFRWGTSHWLFSIALILVISASVAFYAHTNYASTTGNQFLSVAATLASIILAIVAIFIAVSQLIYASHQGNQLDVRLAELKSSVYDLRPIQQSVSDLTGLVSEIKSDQKTLLSSAEKTLLSKAPSVDADSTDYVDAKEPSGQNELIAENFLGENTNLYFAALGVIVASRGKIVEMEGLRSIVKSLLDEEPVTKSNLAKSALPITVITIAGLLVNFGLASISRKNNEEHEIAVDDYLSERVINRIVKTENKLRKKGGSSVNVADLYLKILNAAGVVPGD